MSDTTTAGQEQRRDTGPTPSPMGGRHAMRKRCGREDSAKFAGSDAPQRKAAGLQGPGYIYRAGRICVTAVQSSSHKPVLDEHVCDSGGNTFKDGGSKGQPHSSAGCEVIHIPARGVSNVGGGL